MLNLSEIRALKILYILLETNEFLTIDKIAKHFGLSKRTIQTDIEKINKLILNFDIMDDIQLDKRSGRGIRVCARENDKDNIKLKIKKMYNLENTKENEEHDDYQYKRYIRRIETLRMLINSKEELTIQFLAEQFYVSKSVILKDIEWVNIWLSKFNLKIYKRQNKGICIRGLEKDKRNALVEFLKISNYQNIVTPDSENTMNFSVNDYRVNAEKYNNLKKSYPKINIEKIGRIIKDAEKKYDFFMADEYYEAMLIHLLISIDRILKGNNVNDEDEVLLDQCGKMEYQVAEYIAAQIESEFSTSLPRAEIIYICMHLMGAELYNISDDESVEIAISEIPSQIKEMTNELINFMSHMMSFNFKKDNVLYLGLLFHFKTSIYRLLNNFTLKPFDSNVVEMKHSKLYKIVFAADVLYKKYFNVLPNEEEVTTVALHFDLSMERAKNECRVVFISNASMSANIKMCERIKKEVPILNIVDICNQYQYGLIDEKSYDYIITNVNGINQKSKHVINVSSILDIKDIESIKEIISGEMEVSSNNYGSKKCLAKKVSYQISPKNMEEMYLKMLGTIKESKECSDFIDIEELDIKCFERSIIIDETLWIKIVENKKEICLLIDFNLSIPMVVEDKNISKVRIIFIADNDKESYRRNMMELLK